MMSFILGAVYDDPETLYRYYYSGYVSYDGALDLIDTMIITALVLGICIALGTFLRNSPAGKPMNYLSVRIKDSMIPFIITIPFTRFCLVAFIGLTNTGAGGMVAPIVGAVIFVSFLY